MSGNKNEELRGQYALVTGGSRGIGRAVALQLAAQGMHVAICGRTQESLDATANDIRALGVECLAYTTDVSRNDDIERLVEQLTVDVGSGNRSGNRSGNLSVLVNNAVTSTSARFDELTDDQFRYHLDVKLMAYIRIARLVLPLMPTNGRGRIVNIGGMTARIVAPLRMTNGVVNAGVANFTKQFAGYAATSNVTVNCVHPGYTRTERVQQIFEKEAADSGKSVDDIVEQRTSDIPLGKLIEPDDIATAVMFFCSPMAGMITGQCLAVDGGSGAAIAY